MSKLVIRQLKEIKEHVRQLKDITDDMQPQDLELLSLRSAARQAEQSAACLNRLIGIVETEMAMGHSHPSKNPMFPDRKIGGN